MIQNCKLLAVGGESACCNSFQATSLDKALHGYRDNLRDQYKSR